MGVSNSSQPKIKVSTLWHAMSLIAVRGKLRSLICISRVKRTSCLYERVTTGARGLSCASFKGPDRTVLVYGDSGTGSKVLLRRVKEAARNATVVRSDEAGWTEIRGAPTDRVGEDQDRPTDLALIVVDPLAGRDEACAPQLPLSKVGELGALLSTLLREGRRVSLVFNVQGGEEGKGAGVVQELQDQALALALGGLEEGGTGGGEALVQAIALDLSDHGAGDAILAHIAQRLGPSASANGNGHLEAGPVPPSPLLPPRYTAGGHAAVVLISSSPSSSPLSSAWHRAVQSYCLGQGVPCLLYPLSLALALSPDPTARRHEAKRFHASTEHLPPHSLLLTDPEVHRLVATWTRDWRGQSTHDVSTLPMAGLQAHVGIGPLVAGLATLDHLQHGDRVLVLDLCGCVDGQACTTHTHTGVDAEDGDESEGAIGQLLQEALARQHSKQHSHGRGGEGPTQPTALQVDFARFPGPLPPLSPPPRLVLLRGGCDLSSPSQSSRLSHIRLSSSPLPLLTVDLLRRFLRAPSSLPGLLEPWLPASAFPSPTPQHLRLQQMLQAAAPLAALPPQCSQALSLAPLGLSSSSSSSTNAHAHAATEREYGFRTKSHECNSCESWACGPCTRLQQHYYESCGTHHARDMGAEWRDASY